MTGWWLTFYAWAGAQPMFVQIVIGGCFLMLIWGVLTAVAQIVVALTLPPRS